MKALEVINSDSPGAGFGSSSSLKVGSVGSLKSAMSGSGDLAGSRTSFLVSDMDLKKTNSYTTLAGKGSIANSEAGSAVNLSHVPSVGRISINPLGNSVKQKKKEKKAAPPCIPRCVLFSMLYLLWF